MTQLSTTFFPTHRVQLAAKIYVVNTLSW